MYFYLFEPYAGERSRLHRQATHFIHLHGLTGETAIPSPARPLEDLISRAAEKGYNTIVAVGGDKFISTVASYLTKSDIAFGAIPIGASEKMQELLGVKTIEQAIISLKQRKLAEIGVGIISPNKVFLLEARVVSHKPNRVIVESRTFRAEGTFTTLTIERQDMVAVRFRDLSLGPPRLVRLFQWMFGRRPPDTTETVLRAPVLTVATPEPLPITIHGEKIAETPCKVRVAPGVLKLIQARATLT